MYYHKGNFSLTLLFILQFLHRYYPLSAFACIFHGTEHIFGQLIQYYNINMG